MSNGDDDRDNSPENVPVFWERFKAFRASNRYEHQSMQRDLETVEAVVTKLDTRTTATEQAILDLNRKHAAEQERAENMKGALGFAIKNIDKIILLFVTLSMVWNLFHAPDPEKLDKLYKVADKLLIAP